MALQVFESARAARESTRGTSVTPTRILAASEITHTQTIDTVRPEEWRGNYFGFYSAAAGTERNELSVSGNLDFSMAGWLGYGAVSGAPTLGTPVAGTAFSYTFTPSGTADNLSTYTIETGYNDTVASTAAVRLVYCGINELTLRWDKAASQVTYQAAMLSASTATKLTAFTGTPAAGTSSPLSVSTTQVYLDATTIGTTADNNILTAEWTLSLGWQPLYTLNNTTAAQAVYRPAHRTWTLNLTRYFNSSSEWDVYGTKAERKIRIKTTSSAHGGSAAVTLDLYGVLTNRTLADADGLGIETLEFSPYYDTGVSTDFLYTVVSGDATIS